METNNNKMRWSERYGYNYSEEIIVDLIPQTERRLIWKQK